jgi:hypothetical protein
LGDQRDEPWSQCRGGKIENSNKRARGDDVESIYKERIKRWYDKRFKKKEFKEGDKVLLYNSRFKTFGKGKL